MPRLTGLSQYIKRIYKRKTGYTSKICKKSSHVSEGESVFNLWSSRNKERGALLSWTVHDKIKQKILQEERIVSPKKIG